MPTGGEALVQALRGLDVEVAFGLPGVHNLAAWKAFPASGVRLVGVRHEQSAGYAADGYARATGRLGVALTTTGPGAAHIAAATGEAWACYTPLLVLATDIPTTVRRPGQYRGVLHETTDQASFFRPVTKSVVRVERAQELYERVVLAGRAALRAPRRPVYVEVPTDLLSAEVPAPVELFTAEPAVFVRYVDDAVLQAVVAAQRPLLWAGGGATAASAATAVTALAERLGAPVLTSYGGRGLLPPDHPCLVPLPPHAPAAGALWDAADLVLVLGSDLDAMSTQGFRRPRPPRLVTVDVVEPINVPPDHWVSGDVGRVLQELLGLLPEASRPRWFDRPAGRPRSDGSAFLDAFESGLTDDAVVVADLCAAGDWYGDFGRVGQPRGLAYPVGTLGFGLPAALGSCLSGRPTVALVGNAGFLSACGDLATAAQEHLPVTVVVVDDGTEPAPPDLVALAGAFDVPATEVTAPQLGAAVADGIASHQPNLIVLRARLDPPPGAPRNRARD